MSRLETGNSRAKLITGWRTEYLKWFVEGAVLRPVAGLDRADCRILKRLNDGRVTPRMALRNRIDKLLAAGFVEEKSFGEVAITPRGQLELARWRFRRLPKSRYAILGPVPGGSLFGKIFKTFQSSQSS